ncbi:hypothetical protein KIH39_26395 [Telmatocola sphagniphila]|uniref:Uncharacterized protein n=1 Tax=Telmatocola sphagniphila TaxID=1123043 RepID=A0A8E6EV65_9BACT|nr:hypothetical protein [Telmatocola sphagniphila]QVL32320.1 hypothetical protein KIH39_26395 [Telmatocola sphagniphila]
MRSALAHLLRRVAERLNPKVGGSTTNLPTIHSTAGEVTLSFCSGQQLCFLKPEEAFKLALRIHLAAGRAEELGRLAAIHFAATGETNPHV